MICVHGTLESWKSVMEISVALCEESYVVTLVCECFWKLTLLFSKYFRRRQKP